MNEKIVNRIGYAAMSMASLMYISFVDQIRLNMIGQTGSIFLPLAAIVNCILWSLYGYYKKPRDMKIVWPNAVGILLSIASIITALACTSSCSLF